MTTEEQLRDALRQADLYEPSVDLWARVEGSIEEDRHHRRRVVRTLTGVATMLAILSGFAALSLVGTGSGRSVDWRVMEAVEAALLVAIVLALGPAIRRFGRTLAADVFRTNPATGRRFLLVLDLAYYLVFAGYVMVTTRFARPGALDVGVLASQLEDAAMRTGGLLLLMGVLHVVTVLALPILGIAFTSSWRHEQGEGRGPRPIPTAVLVLGVAAIAAALVFLGLAVVMGTGA